MQWTNVGVDLEFVHETQENVTWRATIVDANGGTWYKQYEPPWFIIQTSCCKQVESQWVSMEMRRKALFHVWWHHTLKGMCQNDLRPCEINCIIVSPQYKGAQNNLRMTQGAFEGSATGFIMSEWYLCIGRERLCLERPQWPIATMIQTS